VRGSAVVTGAARGFGLEIARRLVARGHSVVLCDVDEAGVAAAAESLGTKAVGVAADVRDPDAHRRLAAAAADLGRLEVWVNNAGVAPTGKAWEHGDDVVRRTVEVNVLGTMYGSRAAVDAMRAQGGQIVNIASLAAHGPVPGFAVYGATKASVLSFTLSLQGDLEFAGVPIRTHVLCPDASDTRMVRDVAGEPEAALLFSGSGLLDPNDVADQAVAMLDGRRLVHTIPAWRSPIVRAAALTPSVGLKILRVLRWFGDKRRPEQAPSG
jgi:NAD(P)-dependent dehydrogenase (short-subunit alcohol dehydrogenase family)